MRIPSLHPIVAALCLLAAGTPSIAAQAPATAIVLRDPSLPQAPGLVRAAARAAREAGYEVVFQDVAAFVQGKRRDGRQSDLILLAGARALPASLIAPLEARLRAGSDLLALGLPAWSSPLGRVGKAWMARPAYEEALAKLPVQNVLFDFENGDLKAWRRTANKGESPATHTIEREDGGRVLHVEIANLSGWDTFRSPLLESSGGRGAFPAGHTLTRFRARGGAATRQLCLEWTERDGSRWIATIALTPEWKAYALAPDAFRAWQPPPSRSGKDDHLRVENAVRFTPGLAFSHTRIPAGRHEYWIDDIGTSRNPLRGPPPPDPESIPRLESLCPAYQFFRVTPPVTLATPPSLALVSPAEHIRAPQRLLAMHPRPGGAGFDKNRPWRWQPLVVARSTDGRHRGTVAALIAHAAPPLRGSVWCAFTPAEPSFYEQEPVRRLLEEVLEKTRRGAFLLEGGCEYYTLFERQEARYGARVIDTGGGPLENLTVRLSLADPGKDLPANAPPLPRRTWPVSVDARSVQAVSALLAPQDAGRRGLRVTTELLDGGRLVDRVAHELHVWKPKSRPRFVEVHDGGFRLNGKPWKAHGVNYLPSSGIGVADYRFFEHWLDPAPYDPEVIERDLRRIRDLGLNAVSTFVYFDSLKSQNLLDFLRRCDALGLHVNQSLRPGTPMDFRWEEMKALIEYYRLAENDTVMAYDLAWEPSHYSHQRQLAYTPLWLKWIRRAHGSIEAAEAAWGVPLPRDAGRPSVPPMNYLTRDGPWRKLAADYRAFLDDLLHRKYAEAKRLVRTIDGNHPVSFRMQFAGDPTFNTPAMLPYDFYGLTGAVDIWEPEAYGRIGSWERVKPGRFTADYARLCDPSIPVVWAEMGANAWDPSRGEASPEQLEFIAGYYGDFYDMMRDSGASGVFFWWYPGGFRVGENSDYGIINSDGTDRPVTRVIRREGPRFLAAPAPLPPDTWLSVERDADARGLYGIYEAVREAYWKAIEQGKRPGLRWLRRPGATAGRRKAPSKDR